MRVENINTYRPRLSVLNREQMWSIHAAALEILEKTGFEMKHRDILPKTP
jgi:trimethylamine:corrinoid methyltransferase-like protein